MNAQRKKALRKARRKRRITKIWKFFDAHTSETIVVYAITTISLFSVLDIVLAFLGIQLSPTFEEYFFKFFGFEMLALSGIKISKHIGSAFGKAEEAIDGVVPEDEEEIIETDEEGS